MDFVQCCLSKDFWKVNLAELCLEAVFARPEGRRSERRFVKSLIRAEAANTGPVALACRYEAVHDGGGGKDWMLLGGWRVAR